MTLSDPSSLVFIGTTVASLSLLAWILLSLGKHYRKTKFQFTLVLAVLGLLFVVHEVFELLDFTVGRATPGLSENLQNGLELAFIAVLAYIVSR